MIRRRSLYILATAFATLPMTGAVSAQEASPAAGSPTGELITCTAEPRDVDELLALWYDEAGAPLATPTMSEPIEENAAPPEGEAADEATVMAITEVTQEWIYCVEAVGQHVRAFDLMTDDFASQFGPDRSDGQSAPIDEVRSVLEAQIIGTPTAGPEVDRIPGMAGPRKATLLDDGRVAAIWSFGGDKILFFYEQQGDRWLIDETINLIEAADEPEADATPAP